MSITNTQVHDPVESKMTPVTEFPTIPDIEATVFDDPSK